MYQDVSLFVDGGWTKASGGRTSPVLNPATGEQIGTFAHADKADLERAAQAAQKGYLAWRKVSAFERYKVMRKAGELLRSRVEDIAKIMTLDQGKPVGESKIEILNAADVIDWFAERDGAPMAGSSRRASRAITSSPSRSRSVRSRPSRPGTSRSTRRCARFRRRSPPAARSCSRALRIRPARSPS